MLLGFNDSKCTAYTVDSARSLIVILTHLVLASGKLALQKSSFLSLGISLTLLPKMGSILGLGANFPSQKRERNHFSKKETNLSTLTFG